ncbi:imelysin family protein [Aquimarina sp. W85]|uniref:imelysin family protein n=1 Tax=Aquimarina rhodophyticola TaxID=3342246 RepID=UPI00366FE9E0
MKKFLLLMIIAAVVLTACSSEDDNESQIGEDTFDRKLMLANIADNIIIPAYQNFASDMDALNKSTSSFIIAPDQGSLLKLRETWIDAYVSWQSVSMFEIGKAEEISYRNFMNVYPTTTENVEKNISSGSYDLTTVSQQDEQGFAALDYLINGLSDTDLGTIEFYTNTTSGANYKEYLSVIVTRMNGLTQEVLADWTNGYRDTFVANSGSSATSSVDKLVNDFIFHYEKHLRAGKIGIPAGVFTSEALNTKVEAFYQGDLSKRLFNANLSAMQDLFNGKHYNSSTRGESFRTYLEFLNSISKGEDLVQKINNQFESSRSKAAILNDNFSDQVKTNNTPMLETYDELQKNVVFLKVDMLQAFSVRVDFVDADGD